MTKENTMITQTLETIKTLQAFAKELAEKVEGTANTVMGERTVVWMRCPWRKEDLLECYEGEKFIQALWSRNILADAKEWMAAGKVWNVEPCALTEEELSSIIQYQQPMRKTWDLFIEEMRRRLLRTPERGERSDDIEKYLAVKEAKAVEIMASMETGNK